MVKYLRLIFSFSNDCYFCFADKHEKSCYYPVMTPQIINKKFPVYIITTIDIMREKNLNIESESFCLFESDWMLSSMTHSDFRAIIM
jgi:hypothetical protein